MRTGPPPRGGGVFFPTTPQEQQSLPFALSAFCVAKNSLLRLCRAVFICGSSLGFPFLTAGGLPSTLWALDDTNNLWEMV